MKNRQALGVDIGNVIIDFRSFDPNLKISEENYSSVPATNGVFEALNKLVEHFGNNIFIVSKASESAHKCILKWFKDNNFFEKTGLKSSNIHFCGEKHKKEDLCKDLGITHFIDDQLEVLSRMVGSIPNLFLFQPDDAEVKEFEKYLSKVKVVNNWDETVKKIVGSLDAT